jgi:hypothetical protein
MKFSIDTIPSCPILKFWDLGQIMAVGQNRLKIVNLDVFYLHYGGPNPAKVPNFNIGHDYTLWIRNFMVMMKNPRISILRLNPMAHGHNPAKVPNFKYKE